MIVGWFVSLAPIPKSGGFIEDGAGGSVDGLCAVLQAGIQRRGIYKRFENRSWLALRQSAIQLAGAIVTAADQSFYFTCLRIDSYECDLRPTGVFVLAAWRILSTSAMPMRTASVASFCSSVSSVV